MRLLWYWWQSEYIYILDPWGIYDIEIYMIQYDPIYWIPPNRKRFGSRSARYLGWLIVASNGPQRLGTWGSFILVDPTFISMIQYDVIKIDLSSLFTGYPKDIQRPIQKKKVMLACFFQGPDNWVCLKMGYPGARNSILFILLILLILPSSSSSASSSSCSSSPYDSEFKRRSHPILEPSWTPWVSRIHQVCDASISHETLVHVTKPMEAGKRMLFAELLLFLLKSIELIFYWWK